MNTEKKRTIAILSPSYDGKVACNFSISIAEVFRIAASTRPDLDIRLNYWMYNALVQTSRNNLFSDAYHNEVDDIVFIDGDQSFEPEAFFKVIDANVDVIGIPVRMKTEEERYNIRPENLDSIEYDFDLDLLEVERIGTGFLRLSRKAMQALWDASESYDEDGIERKMICNIQIINGGLISEDIQMCDKLKDAGFKIYVDVAYTCNHFGTKCFKGDYSDYFHKKLIEKARKK